MFEHLSVPCYNGRRYGQPRRLYYRKVLVYGKPPKWIAVGWFCDLCHAVEFGPT